MRIQHLQLEDFRSYADAAFQLETPITFITGLNGAGKSTTIDALMWALMGRCRGTDARGVGSDTLIRQAATQTSVALTIEDANGQPFTVKRTQTARASSLTVDGVMGPKEQQTGAIFERLGVTPAIVDACLNSEAFLALHHAEAKNLLLDVLEVWVTVGDQQLTLPQVEAQYKSWFEERRTRKAALGAIRVPTAPEGEAPDVEALEAQLASLREEEKRLLSTAGQASGRRAEIDRQLAHVQQALARAETAHEASATTTALEGSTVSIEVALDEVQERLSKLADDEADRAANDARIALVDANGRLRTLTDTHQALAQHSPERGCILNGSIPCKTPARAFVAELASLQTQIDDLLAAQNQATKAIETARLRAHDTVKLDARHRTLTALRDQHAKQGEDLVTLRATQASLQAERADCPEPTSGISPELAALQERIRNGDSVIRRAREYAREVTEYMRAKTAAQVAAKALAEAEQKVDQLGPNGLRVQALKAALGQFEASINQALERFGYRLEFVAEPWRVLVNHLPAELLSTSERLRVGIALQLALAEATGFGFVAIDQVDLLDAGNRAILGELLSLRGGVQVLAAATKDDTFEPPDIPGWTWMRVTKADRVSQVGTREAVAV